MSAVRGPRGPIGMPGPMGTAGIWQQRSEPKWERTPWWMFWMPYWRRLDPNAWRTDRYEYRSKRQLAHEFLEKQFSNEKPHTEGGKRRAKL